ARFMSKATTREGKSVVWNGEVPADLVDNLEKSLQLAQAVSYAQGFQQLGMAADAYNW
ncbi:MAG TPA: phosphogluconate dehydrogenase (NADP(+)-dependent, decarboxylating), partial [Lactobacillus acetotolerans]|nr:phosphogluconate dehydrogenase (NADP(+)-dependent, decarboxylating) [Lactobacillus acetotolerans]